jgi:hypothetical protein
MRAMDGRDVNRAVAEMCKVLTPHTTDRDWQAPAGTLSWNCWTTAAHVAHDLLAYAGQVAGHPTDGYLPLDLKVRPEAEPADVLRVVTACGSLLASALATADPDTRAWHYGPADLSGFAAMAVAETVLHTYDITQGLGLDWLPPADLSAAVLHRLRPDAPAGDPAKVLLWATGRGDLPGHERVTSWVWRIP